MKEKEFSDRLASLIEESDEYFGRYGVYIEEDHRINDISRSIVDLMADHYGKVYLGIVNDYKKDSDRIYEYTGSLVKNFEYNFVIPVHDDKIVSLLKSWNKDNDVDVLSSLMNRVNSIGGSWLWWA